MTFPMNFSPRHFPLTLSSVLLFLNLKHTVFHQSNYVFRQSNFHLVEKLLIQNQLLLTHLMSFIGPESRIFSSNLFPIDLPMQTLPTLTGARLAFRRIVMYMLSSLVLIKLAYHCLNQNGRKLPIADPTYNDGFPPLPLYSVFGEQL